jgi:hypothetical protein
MYFTQTIKLRYTQGIASIKLRELNGHDEISVLSTDTAAAIELINRLIENIGRGDTVLLAEKMVTADRDRVIAAIHTNVFGNRINGKSKCRECGQAFELNFMLSDLQRHLNPTGENISEKAGIYYTDEFDFRLPTGEDELAITGLEGKLAVDELLRLCVSKGEQEKGDQIQETMSRIAPVLQAEIKTECPECGLSQQTRFDIQSYFLSKLKEEQKLLQRDVHRLASAYKWSYREIMELPRRLRRVYSKMVDEENRID